MTIDLILYIVTCVSFFMLAFISVLNPLKINITANIWFGLFLFSVGFMLLNVVIYTLKAEADYARLIAFSELTRFAMAPALYLGVLHYTSPNKTFKRKDYLHFIPFLLFLIYIGPATVGLKVTFNVVNLLPVAFGKIMGILLSLSIKVQLTVYWLMAYRKLNQHQENIQQVASNTGAVNLQWLRFLLLGIVFMLLLWFGTLLFNVPAIAKFSTLGYFAGVLFICYFLLAQKEIYPYEATKLEEIEHVIEQGKKSAPTKARFTDEQLTMLTKRLTNLMDTEKLYLDNELGLPQLAAEMSLSLHDLSYVLNEGLGKNFYQFINTYRVDEAKQLMLSPKCKHLNVLGIAYSAGFNSKTTFNTSFKKETGLSPSQFMQLGTTSVAVAVNN